MKKFWFALIALVALTTSISFVIACDDDDNADTSCCDTDSDADTDADTDSDVGGTVLLRAVVADGPCEAGSVYYLSELDNSTPELQIVSTVSGVTNARGEITGEELKENTPYDLRVQCLDFNEILGNVADGEVILNKFFVTGSAEEADAGADDAQYGNVNDISEFMYWNVRTAYASNERTHAAYETINQAAFHNLIPQLPFIVPQDGWLDCDPDTLSIVDGSSPCNDILLGVELPVRFNAVTKAIGLETSLLLENLEKVMNDYEDGILDSDGANVIADVNGTTPFIDVVTAQNNLATYLASVGGTRPDANNVLDFDGDGFPNATDDDIDGDGAVNDDNGDNIANTADCTTVPPTAPCEDEAPYDSSVAFGMYMDTANGIAWPLETTEDTFKNWTGAQTYCDDLNFADHLDWRLPTLSELDTLVSGCDTPPCAVSGGPGVDGCYWPDVLLGPCQSGEYWASDDCGTGKKSTVAYSSGIENCQTTDALSYTRCVRDLP